jgi:hypothetical protein
VPADLLEKLAAMKVNNNNPRNYTQHQYNQQNSQNTPEKKGKKTIRQVLDTEAISMDLSPEQSYQEQSYQAKRQKLEAELRAGTAKQASPKT